MEPAKVVQMPKSPGRGKGNMSKTVMNKTEAWRDAVKAEEWGLASRMLYDRIMDPGISHANLAKLLPIALKFSLVSADAQFLVEDVNEKMSQEAIDAIKASIKYDGLHKHVR